jgi:RNA recognition motif-containing protein
MNGKILPGAEKPIYAAEGMNKKQRESKLKHETIQYKMSKKRCNLYVKNFPDRLSEQDLRAEFSKYGEIESCKIQPANEFKKRPTAFVCFKTPD